jgi:predicted  nucleic acid-binding Zn-ribbon protein
MYRPSDRTEEYLKTIVVLQGLILSKMNRLEIRMAEFRDEFDQGLADLGDAIVSLSDRIDALPNADAITQADIDKLRTDVGRIKELAVAAPTIPTDGTPSE